MSVISERKGENPVTPYQARNWRENAQRQQDGNSGEDGKIGMLFESTSSPHRSTWPTIIVRDGSSAATVAKGDYNNNSTGARCTFRPVVSEGIRENRACIIHLFPRQNHTVG
jgi:hypothetical protein